MGGASVQTCGFVVRESSSKSGVIGHAYRTFLESQSFPLLLLYSWSLRLFWVFTELYQQTSSLFNELATSHNANDGYTNNSKVLKANYSIFVTLLTLESNAILIDDTFIMRQHSVFQQVLVKISNIRKIKTFKLVQNNLSNWSESRTD